MTQDQTSSNTEDINPGRQPSAGEPDQRSDLERKTNDDDSLHATPSQFDLGFLVGVLVGEGHFGGDGKQPQVTLRMHTDHANLFKWIVRHFPGGKLYGPYNHSGRRYFQWMARGAFLSDVLVPILNEYLTRERDQKAFDRFVQMKATYGLD